jgi:hypothetical protein
MARLYADEGFPRPVVEELRKLGHEIVTAQEAGQAGQGISDPRVLAFAVSQRRGILTRNRRHFLKLHFQNPTHFGIILCTEDDDFIGQAVRIDQALSSLAFLDNQLLRIYRPQKP